MPTSEPPRQGQRRLTERRPLGGRPRRRDDHAPAWHRLGGTGLPAAAPEPLCLAEKNHRFAAQVIREARQHASDPDVEKTFAEAVVLYMVKGIYRPMFEPYVRYALGSLYRGEKLVRLYLGDETEIASYLDVGCAYGGAPIAMARRGVKRAVVFEFNRKLLGLARILAAEQGVSDRVKFVSGDLTRPEDIGRLGTFELTTCIDVLEHVLDPRAAIANLARLVAPGGTAVVDVPNPRVYQPIQKDPHHHLFGSVLLDRDDAMRVFAEESSSEYTVGYFYPLEWYIEHLEGACFEVEVMDPPPTDPEAVAETLAAIRELPETLDEVSETWPGWRTTLVREALEVFFADNGDYDTLAREDPAAFQLRHAVPVYHLRCRKPA